MFRIFFIYFNRFRLYPLFPRCGRLGLPGPNHLTAARTRHLCLAVPLRRFQAKVPRRREPETYIYIYISIYFRCVYMYIYTQGVA